jgi:acyl-coenzyme A thioesterase PaaI-like protein
MNGCFGCDPSNAAGLGITFFRDPAGRLAARCTPNASHRGLGRIVHGGLVATFGEELAALEAGARGDGGLAAVEMDVKFERPAVVGTEMTAVVTAASQEQNRVRVAVEISAAGERIATLNSTFVLISAEHLREFAGITLEEAPACLVAARRGQLSLA